MRTLPSSTPSITSSTQQVVDAEAHEDKQGNKDDPARSEQACLLLMITLPSLSSGHTTSDQSTHPHRRLHVAHPPAAARVHSLTPGKVQGREQSTPAHAQQKKLEGETAPAAAAAVGEEEATAPAVALEAGHACASVWDEGWSMGVGVGGGETCVRKEGG